MTLKERLQRARPGDTVYFSGRQRIGKVTNIRGEEDAWITLAGEDDTACLIPDPAYRAATFRPEQSRYFQFGNFAVEGDGRTDRAVQVFTSDHVKIYDLETLGRSEEAGSTSKGFPEDHLHIVGCNHVHIARHRAHGTGGEDMGGGKGPHAIYFTRVDRGGDCEDLVAEDCWCEDIYGGAYQANGDGADLLGVVFRRVQAENYGAMGGSGFNLARCVAPLLEDVTLHKHPRNNNPGVNSYDGTTGTRMNRYVIDASPRWAGPMDARMGTPAPPQFGEAPEPPEPPPVVMVTCPRCNGTGQIEEGS